jgi:hypothetical protein
LCHERFAADRIASPHPHSMNQPRPYLHVPVHGELASRNEIMRTHVSIQEKRSQPDRVSS